MMTGVEVIPLTAGVRVLLTRDADVPNTDAVQREWDRQRLANPRLYDGGLLSVLHLTQSEQGPLEVTARRDRFARLSVQPRVPTGVRILSVTGILTARDARGSTHALFGQRGKGTRIYDGLWELGPSGGLSPPPAAVRELHDAAIFAHLADEVSEEVGLHMGEGRAVCNPVCNPVCITRDHRACSDDICYVCDLGDFEKVRDRSGPANWEYAQTRWVQTTQVRAFFAEVGEAAIIPPTLALARFLGWV